MRATSDKLHLGCGPIVPEGWVNVDGSLNARLSRHQLLKRVLIASGLVPSSSARVEWPRNIVHHDVRKPLPWPDASFRYIYSSHLLEHLYLDEGRRLLADCFRVLEPGGTARFVVPDLEAAARDYLAKRPHPFHPSPAPWYTVGDMLNVRLLFHDSDSPKGNFLRRAYTLQHNFHKHKWMYDAESLVQRFTDTGFVDVKRMRLFESRIPDIQRIENSDRVEDGGLAVEGVKPMA